MANLGGLARAADWASRQRLPMLGEVMVVSPSALDPEHPVQMIIVWLCELGVHWVVRMNSPRDGSLDTRCQLRSVIPSDLSNLPRKPGEDTPEHEVWRDIWELLGLWGSEAHIRF